MLPPAGPPVDGVMLDGPPPPLPGKPGGMPPNQISLLFPALGPKSIPPPEPSVPTTDCHRMFWVDADYMLLWFKHAPNSVPLLVTGTPVSPVVNEVGGPTTGTQVLFGGSNLNFGPFEGFRISAGEAITDHCGVEVRAFVTEQRNITFAAGSDSGGNPGLFRPFYEVKGNSIIPAVAAVSQPGVQTGAFYARSFDQLWGGDLNLLLGTLPTASAGTTFIGGFAFRQYNGDLALTEKYSPLGTHNVFFDGTPIPPPAIVLIQDRYLVHNWFVGIQAGANRRWTFGSCFLDVRGVCALGSTQQEVTISGASTLYSSFGRLNLLPTQSAPGGLYALESNIGKLEKSRVSVIPTLDIRGGWNVTKWMVATVGYTGMYWSSVAYPGDQVNRILNVTEVPTFSTFNGGTPPAQPKPIIRSRDFWAQGLTAGLEFRF
jgi:hypothetical protein